MKILGDIDELVDQYFFEIYEYSQSGDRLVLKEFLNKLSIILLWSLEDVSMSLTNSADISIDVFKVRHNCQLYINKKKINF